MKWIGIFEKKSFCPIEIQLKEKTDISSLDFYLGTDYYNHISFNCEEPIVLLDITQTLPEN